MKLNKTIIMGTMFTLFAACSLPVNTTVLHPTSPSVSDFEKQIADGIVIVDFFATWCGPCQRFAPTFEKVSNSFTEIKFIKVDVDAYNAIARRYSVRSMPTIMIFKNGTKVATKLGAMSYSEFSSWISNYLK